MYVLNDKKAPPALLMLRLIKIGKQDHSAQCIIKFSPPAQRLVGRAYAEDCLNRVSNICSKKSTPSHKSTTRQTCSGIGQSLL